MLPGAFFSYFTTSWASVSPAWARSSELKCRGWWQPRRPAWKPVEHRPGRTLSSNTSWDSTPQAVVASVAGALGGLRFSTRHPRAAFGLQKPEGHPYAPGTRSPDLTNRGRRNHGGPGSNGKMAARHSPTLFPALGGPRQRVARTRPE